MSELISVRAWIEKHSFDQGDSFNFLVGKTLDGVLIRSLTTKVSEIALDSYINDVRAAQKRKPPNKYKKKTSPKTPVIFTANASKIKSSMKHCTKCNEELENNAIYCSECGAEQNNSMEINSVETSDFIKEYDKIFIDTCSLMAYMAHGIKEFSDFIVPILNTSQKKLFVLKRVKSELKGIADDKKDKQSQDTIEKAKNAINFLEKYSNFIDFYDDLDEENIADNVFLSVFTRLRTKYKLLLITQDKELSRDIMQLNKFKSVKGKPCVVYHIEKNGQYMLLGRYGFGTGGSLSLAETPYSM
ncbi:MAG: hypothetical protein LBU89_03025 [Fibromonadaceae bacterium]|jgi:rRNA-processing protein FCF1|nr:hypothetical protein [Fibromonadaceae bacterium]